MLSYFEHFTWKEKLKADSVNWKIIQFCEEGVYNLDSDGEIVLSKWLRNQREGVATFSFPPLRSRDLQSSHLLVQQFWLMKFSGRILTKDSFWIDSLKKLPILNQCSLQNSHFQSIQSKNDLFSINSVIESLIFKQYSQQITHFQSIQS